MPWAAPSSDSTNPLARRTPSSGASAPARRIWSRTESGIWIPGTSFARKRGQGASRGQARRAQVGGAADDEGRGAADVGAGLVDAGVEILFDQADQSRGGDVVVVHRLGVVAGSGRVAHDDEDIAHAQGVGRQQVPPAG